jgi:hypothetical protein
MSVARQRLANRFDLSLPENQRKLDAAEQLGKPADEAGLTWWSWPSPSCCGIRPVGPDLRPAARRR